MPVKDLVIGVDCSTTAAKAIVWDAGGRAVSEGRAPIELLSPRPGWYEQRARDWWDAASAAIRQSVAAVVPERLAAISITHQRETFVPLDESGEALSNAIVWMDERAAGQVDSFGALFGRERILGTTGKPPCVTPSLYKMLWLRANERALFRRAVFADVHAYLTLRLTGELATAVASADPMGLCDLRRGDWDDDLLDAAGLDRQKLPRLVATGSVLGRITGDAARATGLPEGIPVVAGGGDGQIAALGAGLVGPGRAYLNLGTAVVLGVVSPTSVTSLAFRTMAGAQPGTFVLESDLKGGAFTIEWLLERFGGGSSAADLDRLAGPLPPGAGGLVAVPYWASVMNPYWDDEASGIVVGWTGAHGPGHLHRAILEGIAMEQRLAIERMEPAAGSIGEIVVLGGGAKSDLWRRIIADATARRVVPSGTVEATCLGAGILAAVGAGLHPDLVSAVRAMTFLGEAIEPGPDAPRYERLFREVYQPLYPSVREILGRLAAFRRAGE
ncbi:MAG: FGGY-family carbohydrate kinase [Deltaproteobacteria bacterium]|nr:FGGY-family carbohydrate kinase [Deltaproteobacteria bacterium]